jgi:hypothetical protein
MRLVFLFTLFLHLIYAELEVTVEPAHEMVTMTEWVTRIETSVVYKVISERVVKTINVTGTKSKVHTKTLTSTLTNVSTVTELSFTVQTMYATEFAYVTATLFEEIQN